MSLLRINSYLTRQRDEVFNVRLITELMLTMPFVNHLNFKLTQPPISVCIKYDYNTQLSS